MALNRQESYYELAEHNIPQRIVFGIIFTGLIVVFFLGILNLFSDFFEGFLNGIVYNSGETLPYTIDKQEPVFETSFLYSWAVDIYVKTESEARYWFNPVLSIFLPSSVMALVVSVVLTTLLPRKIGYMRHKIEREIANAIESICLLKFGYKSEDEFQEIVNDLDDADLQTLHNYVSEWGIPLEDLKIIKRALLWRRSSIIYKIFHLDEGIRIYMRFHFTIRYGNIVLGLVYIGAAVLIIIIGLRGLKFIPPTQPSLVLFALGLEFTLLVIYAFTLMYTKQEEEGSHSYQDHHQSSGKSDLLGNDYGNTKDVENLLRVFIKTNPKKK